MKTLADFRNVHAGQSIIVCGLGESVRALSNVRLQDFVTIGVNDIGQHFDPTYLVVVNKPEEFNEIRALHITMTAAVVDAVFTCYEVRFGLLEMFPVYPVTFKLDNRPGIHLNSDDSLPFSNTSPYVAAALAAYMGARHIGLIGVDFIGHKLSGDLRRINRDYKRLRAALFDRGQYLVNLSQQSRLESVPKISIEEFAQL